MGRCRSEAEVTDLTWKPRLNTFENIRESSNSRSRFGETRRGTEAEFKCFRVRPKGEFSGGGDEVGEVEGEEEEEEEEELDDIGGR